MQEVGYIKYNNVGEDYTGKWKSLGCIDGCLYKEDVYGIGNCCQMQEVGYIKYNNVG